MTKMYISRIVVEQALEALKNNAGEMRVEGAISILETALAQQAEPQDAELSAALGWPGGISEPVLDRKTLLRQVADLRAALAQQAEAVQEPVLVVEKEPDYWGRGHFHQGSKPHIDPTKVWNLPIGTKLYTTPPQRTMVPLTEDEIYHATGHCGVSRYTAINITRAVEKAAWEKNNGQA